MNRDDTSKPAATGPLSDHERADLVLMREEERLARDLYRRFHQAWDVPIFANIAASEQRHYDAIGRLLKRYDVPDPSAGKPPGVYADTELQDAGFVDRAGKYWVACHLINRDTFAGDRRLIDRTAACRHLTIERYSGAGFDPHTGFQLYLCGRHFPPRSIRLPDFRRLRRQVEQALDGVTRPIHGAGLDQFGNGIQGHDHRRLGPLADQEGTGHRHTHQRVHVQLPAPQCRHAFAIGRNAGQPDGDDG